MTNRSAGIARVHDKEEGFVGRPLADRLFRRGLRPGAAEGMLAQFILRTAAGASQATALRFADCFSGVYRIARG
jgi:hypothetical protein